MEFVALDRFLPSTTETVPWKFVLTSLSAMLLLAAFDFVGAVFAKEWADTRQPWWFAAGLLTFVGLFCVYANSLKTAELSIVTIGWVVFLQVGLLLYERVRYGTELPPQKWVAIALVLLLQAYLVLSPNGGPADAVVAAPAPGAELTEAVAPTPAR